MDTPMTKERLLETLESGHARWQRLLAEVGEGRMLEPGVEGDWSVKDIVSHVTYYENALASWLEALARGEQLPGNPENEGLDMDQRNALVYEKNNRRTLQDVLTESRVVFSRLLSATKALSEEDLTDSHKFAWTEGEPAWHAVPGDSYDHYLDHEASIRAWLARQPARRA